MKEALIVIDVQNDYFEGGRCEVKGAKEATFKIKNLIDKFRKANKPIFYVKHINTRPDATLFIEGTKGTEISDIITPEEQDSIIIKHYKNSFLHTDLQEKLLKIQIDHLVVCGMMTHMCVDTTVRVAKGLGYGITLVEDACATKDLMWNSEIIKSSDVQKVYMASLNKNFADVCVEKHVIL